MSRRPSHLWPVALAVVLFLPCRSFADAGGGKDTASGGVRIGYVDFNKALNSVSDGRRAKQRLKDEFKEKQQQLDRLQKGLAALKNDIDKDRLILSDADLKRREREYRDKFFDLQQMLVAYGKEMEARELHLTQEILKNLRDIVKDLGNSEGYSLILEKSQDVVLYAPQGQDLTAKVIEMYDRHFKQKGR